MHRNSELLFRKYATHIFKNNMRVLEISPAGAPSIYEKIINNNKIIWETLDLCPLSKTTYIADSEYTFAVPDETFDIVFSSQVIEHVRKIWIWIKELSRICKPGGFVPTINPVNWPYHKNPYDCWRIYPEGMRSLYEDGDLEVILVKIEALDKSYTEPHYCLARCKKMLKNPIYSIKKFVYGFHTWQDWMAYDVITIGKKKT